MDIEWLERAACRGLSPRLFFATGKDSDTVLQRRVVKSVCNRCPVQSECLVTALLGGADDYGFGIFGGMTVNERRRIKQLLVPDAKPTSTMHARLARLATIQPEPSRLNDKGAMA